jgi:molybdopterin-guanine dinucleotide biosynthesis protein A
MGATRLVTYDAIVLAGGSARRLGGVDKPSLVVGERTLLDAVLDAAAQAGRTVVVGPARPVSRPVTWTREDPPGGGPVAALAAGLPLVEAPLVAVLAADLPFLTAAVLDRLVQAATGHDGALLVDSSGRDQVLLGVWVTDVLRRAMPDSPTGARVARVLAGLDAVRVPETGTAGGPPPWFDCDTDEDLMRARGTA